MKIQLLDAEDLKAIAGELAQSRELEDLLFRAFSRALRVVNQEGQVTGYVPPKVEATPPTPVQPVAPKPWGSPEVNKSPPPPSTTPKPKFGELYKLIPTVQHRPHGWIDRSEAVELIGGSSPDVAIRQWILRKDVEAVIVSTHAGSPHKGLPGRVHLNKAQLIARNEKRKMNSDSMEHVRAGRHNGKEARA